MPSDEEDQVDAADALEAAWAGEVHSGDVWTARPWVAPRARWQVGRTARKAAPRTSHAAFELPAARDPVAILADQEAGRLPDLLPLRHERMAESAFAYFRGTPAVMAFDLAGSPRTAISVQASGDAHLSNFGLFASPERTLVFDLNDFDETLPGPWEWDVKRLATSAVIAGRANGLPEASNRKAALAAVRGYRQWMAHYAGMHLIDIWYDQITDVTIRQAVAASPLGRGSSGTARRRGLEDIFAKARSRDRVKAYGKLTSIVDGRRLILDDPPLVQHHQLEQEPALLELVFTNYRATMAQSRREFLERYRFVDYALKVVGVGSVATRCFIVILAGRGAGDPLVLQAKEATASVLEPFVGPGEHDHHGQRVVVGQRRIQATPDIFLGWTRARGRDYYFRQLWDMKGSVDLATLELPDLAFYAGLCGWALARAHARSGDAIAISAYLGRKDLFDGAVADYAEAYADQNERDHAGYLAAIRAGRVAVSDGWTGSPAQ